MLIIDCLLKAHLHMHRHSLKLNGLYVGVGLRLHSSGGGKKAVLLWKHVRVSKWWQKSVFWGNYSCKCACFGSMACVCWLWWESKCVLVTVMFILSSTNLCLLTISNDHVFCCLQEMDSWRAVSIQRSPKLKKINLCCTKM